MKNIISSEHLKSLIYASGSLSVNEIANKIGMPQPTLFRLLNGKTHAPKKEVLQKIADYLGISLSVLMEKITPPQNQVVEIPVFLEKSFTPEIGFNTLDCVKKISFEVEKNSTDDYKAILLENFKNPISFSEKMIVIINSSMPLKDRSLVALYIKKDKKIIIERVIKEGDKAYIKYKKKPNNELSLKTIDPTELLVVGVVIETRFLEVN